MTDKEHRDVYIAAAVAGLGLVLIYLYLYSGQNVPVGQAATDASGAPITPGDPSFTEPALPSPYNYNIAPYQPGPPISIPPANFKAGNATNTNISATGAAGSGCCDKCGPQTGSKFFLPNVAQFSTLLGTGAG